MISADLIRPDSLQDRKQERRLGLDRRARAPLSGNATGVELITSGGDPNSGPGPGFRQFSTRGTLNSADFARRIANKSGDSVSTAGHAHRIQSVRWLSPRQQISGAKGRAGLGLELGF